MVYIHNCVGKYEQIAKGNFKIFDEYLITYISTQNQRCI